MQANRELEDPSNPIGGMDASRLKEFLRMNPLEFHGYKVEKDPNEFIEEVYKVLAIIGVSSIDKGEISAYKLKYDSKFCMTNGKIVGL